MTARPAHALAVVVLLGGCVAGGNDGLGPIDDSLDAATLAARNDAALDAFDRFRVQGGLGIWDDEQSLSAKVDWRQQGEALDIELVAPLGLGSARLVRAEDGQASLSRGSAPPLVGDSADTVLQRALGLDAPVPLDQLASWLRGLPGDGRDVRRDDRGRLESLRWTDAAGVGWQARVLDRTTVAGLSLPRLVTAQGSGYRLRLVLHDWTADDETSTPAVADPSAGAGTIGAGDAGASGGSIGPDAPPKRRVIPGR